MSVIRCLLLALTVMLPNVVLGAPMSPKDVPEPLQGWVGWAMHGHERIRCPLLVSSGSSDARRAGDSGARECVWGRVLELSVGDSSARFRQAVQVHAPTWVELPGGAGAWPESVRVDGALAVVVHRAGRPALWLGPGAHEIDGEFRWPRLPPHLRLPAQAGLLTLMLRGVAVAFPDRDADNQVWFGRSAGEVGPAKAQGNTVQVDVFRRLIDDVPLRVVTRIEMSVGGAAREVLLGRALMEGFIPLALNSQLPARLESDGRVRLQARAGRWTVTLTARHHGPVTQLSLPDEQVQPWAEQEVWVFDARNALRVVELEGLAQVDPKQTRLPEKWMGLPAYLAGAGDILQLQTRRRGNPEPEPDQLSLKRTLWLDFDGGGYSFSDNISGRVNRSWRIDATSALKLGRVVVNGQAQFITAHEGREGVEIREGQLSLTAEGRIGKGEEVPVGGWKHEFRRTRATLNLPPGWRLATATGVDKVSPTWVGRWTLFDLFLVLIVGAIVGRLWGWRWGLVALLGLALAWHEPGAPRQVWLHVLGAAALLKVLPEGHFRTAVRFYWGIALATLVVLAVPFVVSEVRMALYPQLERQHGQQAPYFAESNEAAANQQTSRLAELAPPSAVSPSPRSRGVTRKDWVGSSLNDPSYDASQQKRKSLAVVDPNANVQTGPGLPRWQWQRVTLQWSGPVREGEKMRLVLISPHLMLGMRLLAVLLLGALVVRLVDLRHWRANPSTTATACIVACALGASAMPRDAEAELPGAPLLESLRERLLEPPECLPGCAHSPHLTLQADADTLRMTWFVHAFEDVAVPLPGGTEQWLPSEILVDDAPAQGMRLRGKGELWLHLPRGRHVVRLSGALPPGDRLALALGLAPERVEAELQGWILRGVHPDGRPEGPLQLQRERVHTESGTGAKDAAVGLKPRALPPFVQVERTLVLSLEWRVRTQIRRLSPKGVAVALAVPLLAGESVTTDGLNIEDAKVQITLGPDATVAGWESVLKPQSPIMLIAPDDTRWTETWQLEASPIWHVDAQGIPVVHDSSSGRRVRQWRPWPGESVVIGVSRPNGVPGRTLTVEASQLKIVPGARTAEATLKVSLRSSQGARHGFTLPQGVELQSVSLNGRAEPIRPDGRVLTLPLGPGSHNAQIVWRSAHGVQALYRTPAVGLGVDSVNATVQIAVPSDRWVLYTGGPALGPAVLFWGVLAVLLVVAVGLARTGRTPLGVTQWALLSLGLSQVPVWLSLGVVGWLFALDARERLPEPCAVKKTQFNLVQVALVLLTALALAILFFTVQQGLLGRPDMQIAGNGSSARLLSWFDDRIGPDLPSAWVLSVPMWVYRVLMLAWALWLAFAVVGWVRWGFGCFSKGRMWRPLVWNKRPANPRRETAPESDSRESSPPESSPRELDLEISNQESERPSTPGPSSSD